MDFALSTKSDLNIDLPLDLKIPLVGKVVGQKPDGDLLVEWTVDFALNASFSTRGTNVNLTHISGSLLTRVRLILPRQAGLSCSGAPRSFGIWIETVPGNELRVKAEALGLGVEIGAINVSFTATAGDQFAVNGRIAAVVDGCGIGAPKGQPQTFIALVDDAGGQPITYQWSAIGGTILGSDQDHSAKVRLESDQVQVQVEVDVGGVVGVIALKHVAETDKSISIKRLLCRLVKYLNKNFRFNPLWDPLRDPSTQPYSSAELRQIRATAAGMIRQIDGVLDSRSPSGR